MTDPIRFADLTASRWPNGAGRKADIASGEGWLVAFAWLDADAPFSDYRCHDRTITLTDGAGFVLDFAPPTPSLLVDASFRPTPFDGGWPATCRLPAGPCLVLNAMTARQAWRHQVSITPAHIALPAVDGQRFIVVLRGSCTVHGGPALGPRDALRSTAAATLGTASDALLAVVHIRPATA